MKQYRQERREHAEMIACDSRIEVYTANEKDPSQIVLWGYVGQAIPLNNIEEIEVALHIDKALKYYHSEVKRLDKVIINLEARLNNAT